MDACKMSDRMAWEKVLNCLECTCSTKYIIEISRCIFIMLKNVSLKNEIKNK